MGGGSRHDYIPEEEKVVSWSWISSTVSMKRSIAACGSLPSEAAGMKRIHFVFQTERLKSWVSV
jgi:hypothetical protein